MPEISIIVPVYNAGKYLKKCFDSILAQTFGDFELLLIDDGSIDESSCICDEYITKDNRVKVIHQKNGGVSSARNTGLDTAVGKYIGFVDSDDFIKPDMYETLYNDLINYNADISICGIEDHYKNQIIAHKDYNKTQIFDHKTALKLVLEGRTLRFGSINKLYKKELFENLRFPVGKIYEDAFMTPNIIIKAKKITFNPEAKYVYFHRASSITTNEFKPEVFDLIHVSKGHLEMIKRDFPDLIKVAEFGYLLSYASVLDIMVLSPKIINKKAYDKVVKMLKKNILKILFNSHFSKNRKLATIILFFSGKLYKKVKIWMVNKYYKPFDD